MNTVYFSLCQFFGAGRIMRLVITLIVPLLLFPGCRPSPEKDAIARQLRDYPETRVQDIYKSFCQDKLGPGHLIPDLQSARAYLQSELEAFRNDLDNGKYDAPAIRYYPAGDEGNYVRVDLSVVLDGLMDGESFLGAFVRSANEGKRASEEQWLAKWQEVREIIRKDFPDIPDAENDLDQIDSAIRAGGLILHHSEAYSEAYNPHYRIIARDIFEKEIRPLID